MKEDNIYSWDELQKNISKIVVSLNKDENLKLAAAANPILALQELGYHINKDEAGEFEEKIRFKPSDSEKLSQLRSSIYMLAGKKFNLRSEDELNEVLFSDLKIESYDKQGCVIKKYIRNRKNDQAEDELIEFQYAHPVIEKLIEFRKIDASVAAFASKDIYQRIRNGQYGERSNIRFEIKFKKGKK